MDVAPEPHVDSVTFKIGRSIKNRFRRIIRRDSRYDGTLIRVDNIQYFCPMQKGRGPRVYEETSERERRVGTGGIPNPKTRTLV